MRNSFRDALITKKEKYKNLFLIVGDIGFGVFERFQECFPENYLNIGICEANTIGVASGLSRNGYIPIVYTIVPFLTMRPFEQIRIDLALHNCKVVLVGVGGGFAYGNLGPTHHSFEDLSLMSILPNMRVFSPSQPSESELALRLALQHDGPSYIRLGKNGEPDLSSKVIVKKDLCSIYTNKLEDTDHIILTYGAITLECIKSSEILSDQGIKVTVVSFYQLKPIPVDIIKICMNAKKVIIVEEHSIYNSIGTHIISLLASKSNMPLIKILGVDDVFTEVVGDRNYLLKHHGLDAQSIAKSVKDFVS